jgi:hypothetical protein
MARLQLTSIAALRRGAHALALKTGRAFANSNFDIQG